MNNKLTKKIVIPTIFVLLILTSSLFLEQGVAAAAVSTSQTITSNGLIVSTVNRINGIWTQAGSDVTLSECAFYLSKDVSLVYIETGYWKSDGSIHYFISPNEIQTTVANAHAAGLKIYPWITSQAVFGDVINIGTPSLRQNAFNSMVNLVQTYGFDGMADDVERVRL